MTSALYEPEVRCPGFIFTLLLHLPPMCGCVQGSSEGAAGDGERDSEDGHLIYNSGDVIKDRCTSQFEHTVFALQGCGTLSEVICFLDQIVDTLGEGTFGKVVQCLDRSR